jgi:hypothetical protein
MILVRFVFQVKWGRVQEVVNQTDRMAGIMRRIYGPKARARVLTDLSGPFNTVVQEVEVESLAEWEQIRARMFADPEFQAFQASRDLPYESGRTEFYTIERTYEPEE